MSFDFMAEKTKQLALAITEFLQTSIDKKIVKEEDADSITGKSNKRFN